MSTAQRVLCWITFGTIATVVGGLLWPIYPPVAIAAAAIAISSGLLMDREE